MDQIVKLENRRNWIQFSANYIKSLIEQSVQEKGYCNIAVSGGATPLEVYHRLSSPKMIGDSVIEKLNVFLVDERVVPVDCAESNYFNIRKAFEDRSWRLYPMYDHLLGLDSSIKNYEHLLEKLLPRSFEGFPRFDVIILGFGEDGHIASLFPNTLGVLEEDKSVTQNYVPKLNALRITLTFPVLRSSLNIVILFFGRGKRDLLFGNALGRESLPIMEVAKWRNGKCYIHY